MRAKALSQVSRIFAGQASNAIFGLITAICLTRALTVEEYGQYVYVLQLLGFFAFLAMPGMTTAVLQGAAKGFDEVLVSGTRRRLIFSLAGSIGIFGVVMWRWPVLDDAMRIMLLSAAVAFPAYVCISTYFYYLNGKRRYGMFALYYFLQSGTICLCAVTAALLTHSFVVTTAAAIGGKILADTILYQVTLRRFVTPGAGDYPDALRVGWHLSLVSIIGCVSNNFDKLIVGMYISFEVLALYAIADMIAGQFKIVTFVMDNYLSPVIVNESPAEAKARLLRRCVQYTALTVVLAAAAYAVVTVLLGLLFGSQYAESMVYVGPLLAINILAGPGSVCSVHLRACKKLAEVYLFKFAETAALIIGFLWFVPLFGIWGVIGALALSYVAYTASALAMIYVPGFAEGLERSAFGRFVVEAFAGKKAEAS